MPPQSPDHVAAMTSTSDRGFIDSKATLASHVPSIFSRANSTTPDPQFYNSVHLLMAIAPVHHHHHHLYHHPHKKGSGFAETNSPSKQGRCTVGATALARTGWHRCAEPRGFAPFKEPKRLFKAPKKPETSKPGARTEFRAQAAQNPSSAENPNQW